MILLLKHDVFYVVSILFLQKLANARNVLGFIIQV